MCTLPVSNGCMGVGFTLETGEIIRLKLQLESIRHLCESIDDYLSGRLHFHSDKSSGMPSSEVSMPAPAEKV